MKQFISSESVSEGHPDKLCDQVSDAVLDEMLAQDVHSRVACECLATTWLILVAGEVTTTASVDIQSVVRKVVKDIWYTDPEYGIDADHCAVLVTLHGQSPDIAQWVNADEWLHLIQGAGDQGLMYGFACDETAEYMPLPIMLAHKITQRLADVRKQWVVWRMRPDSKAQVTIEYEHWKALRADTIVVSTQHDPDVSHEQISCDVMKHVIEEVCADRIDEKTLYHINPTWKFVIWGPHGDTGLTGRKIIVDSYGGVGRHGWWAFSGKDPSKVDRSAAYMARYLAKNIVASCVCQKCEIQLSYAIWVAQPTSIFVDCFGTETMRLEEIVSRVAKNIDLSPAGIIKHLDLLRPIYLQTASYGHFGKSYLPWEQLDLVGIFG